MTSKQRFEACAKVWAETMPNPQSELHYESPYQLLVAVMLSAQCTDKRINMVTPALFAAYPTIEALSKATAEEVFAYVRSVSYPNAKSGHLVEMARAVCEHFGGQLPTTVDLLTTLPGVGRKTANVVCAVLWDQPTMAVDTHIFRISERIGFTTNSKNPLQTEKALMKIVPNELIPKAHHWLLLHGRYICTARNPKCETCLIKEFCRTASSHR